MKQYSALFLAAAFFLASCGSSKKEGDAAANDKKVQLEKLKKDKTALDEKIKAIEADLSKTDTSMAAAQKTKLVAIQELQPAAFTHYIELQGKIDAENISYITPRGGPGQVRAI